MDLRKLKPYCRIEKYPDRKAFIPNEEITVLLDGHDKALPIKRMIAIDDGRFVVDCDWLLFFGTSRQRKNTSFYDSKGKKIA